MGSEIQQAEEPNPNLYFGTSKFQLPNGDIYTGEYCAHRIGVIWREGRGTYVTKDGHSYEGLWKDDHLVEESPLFIKYPSGDEYHGCILEEKYSGGAHYTLKNKMDISCTFADNKPMGTIFLIDVNGRLWEGEAGENGALLRLENAFFHNIPATEGIGRLKEKSLGGFVKEENISQSSGEILSDRELEKIVFAKSDKTAPHIDFTDSKWYRRYKRFLKMKGTVTKKLKEGRSLSKEETKWNEKYEKYKAARREKEAQKLVDQLSTVDTSLLEKFYSKRFKNSSPAMKVFYPETFIPKKEESDEEIELKSEELT